MASQVVKGFAAPIGFTPGSVWGTPVVVGATKQLEYVSESLTPDSQLIPDEQNSGQATQLFGDKGNEFHNGNLVLDMRYEGIETLIAMAMGTAGAPVQQGVTTAYLHTFKPAANKEGIFGTLVKGMNFEVWEYPSVKVGGFTFDSVAGRRARWTFQLIPGSLNINAGTGTNNTTTIGTLTLPANRDFALFSQLVMRLNGTDAGALATPADLVYLSEFHLSGNNNFPTDDVTTRFGNKIDEPVQNGFTEFTGSMVFSKYESANKVFATRNLDKTRYKADVVYTGPLADTPHFYTLKFFLPDLQIASAPANISGPGRVPMTASFRCNRKLTVPTGFPAGYLDPVTIELINKRNSNPLV